MWTHTNAQIPGAGCPVNYILFGGAVIFLGLVRGLLPMTLLVPKILRQELFFFSENLWTPASDTSKCILKTVVLETFRLQISKGRVQRN
jgi:hypothetical protein